MTGCTPFVDADGKLTGGYLCRGTGTRYVARARWYGHRRYELLGKPTKSFRVALRRLADAMAKEGGLTWKRGDVLMTADYYDPILIVEMVRR